VEYAGGAEVTTLALFPRTASEADSTDAQCTPRDVANDLGRFDLDVCSNPRSHILADRSFMLEYGQDGLAEAWTRLDGSPASVWCNGPYSDPLPWCERLRQHSAPWASLWKLDTTTRWFAELMASGASWAPFRDRLRFERPGNCGVANFTSVLVWRDWTPSAAMLARLWIPRAPARKGLR
jgi:hypothetical protein